MTKSEQAKINENARKKALQILNKQNKPKVCEICNTNEEILISFRDNNLLNSAITNLYYLCRPCSEVRASTDGRKRADYTACDICKKTRLVATNLFDERKICTTCFKKCCKEKGTYQHNILIPVTFNKQGLPLTLYRVWMEKCPSFMYSEPNLTEQEKLLMQNPAEYQKSVILKVANFIHQLPIEKIKEMYYQTKDNESKTLFMQQILPEDRIRLYKMV